MLEVWGRLKSGELELIKRYPITGFSGGPGLKLRDGDGQIPEGIYAVEYLNPNSHFHLSIKLNYPNAFDKAKGKADGRVFWDSIFSFTAARRRSAASRSGTPGSRRCF